MVSHASLDNTPPVTLPNAAGPKNAWGHDGFSFGDLVDIINPLQHVPVVSWAYRAVTGDDIAPAAKLAGGGLFGGWAGLAMSIAEVAITDTTGKGIEDLTMAWLSTEKKMATEKAPQTMVTGAALPTVSDAEDAILTAAFGPNVGTETLPPGSMALPPEQAAMLLTSLGLPQTVNGQNILEPKPDPEKPQARAVDDAKTLRDPTTSRIPEDALSRTQFLTTAAAAGADIQALFGKR